jgi:hypothetical protein
MHSALKRRFMFALLQVHFGVVPNKANQPHHRRRAFEVKFASRSWFDLLLHTLSRLLSLKSSAYVMPPAAQT